MFFLEKDFDLLRCPKSLKSKMKKHGFCHLRGTDFSLSDEQFSDLKEIQEYFHSLPVDPYDDAGQRLRQLSRYIIIPFKQILIPRPDKSTRYVQNIRYNDEINRSSRVFDPISEEFRDSKFIQSLIYSDFHNSPFSKSDLSLPIDVGVHLIRMQATPEAPGLPTPNKLHKDGEPFTWIHLISRENVFGGENIITDNTKEKVLCHATLEAPMDTIGIVDSAVWHQVKPIFVNPLEESGFRDAILVDFTVMTPQPLSPPVLELENAEQHQA